MWKSAYRQVKVWADVRTFPCGKVRVLQLFEYLIKAVYVQAPNSS